MSELIPVLEILVADVEAGRAVALCAVLQTRGSTPQVPGATMLVRSDGSTVGTVGGGSGEAEVTRQALERLQQNQGAVVRLALDSDYGWDDALICGGEMTVGVMPIAGGADLTPFRTALELAGQRRPAQVPVVVEDEGRRLEYRVRLEVPPTLLIAGAGHVGQALARLAVELDFHVVVIDDRAELASRARFGEPVGLTVGNIAGVLRDYPIDAGCYVVIVTRGHRHDRQALEAVIGRGAGYVGMIASRRKAALILNALAEAGIPREQIDGVHTPIGLPIGALTVNELAVSIAAELIQVRRHSTPTLVEGPLEMTP